MDNKQTTQEKIKIMQAYVDGAELQFYSDRTTGWVACQTPLWSWDDVQYRVKAPVNWEIVKWYEEGGRVDTYHNNVYEHRKVNNYYWDFLNIDYRIVNERRESNND